jgi:hypothetical protein
MPVISATFGGVGFCFFDDGDSDSATSPCRVAMKVFDSALIARSCDGRNLASRSSPRTAGKFRRRKTGHKRRRTMRTLVVSASVVCYYMYLSAR